MDFLQNNLTELIQLIKGGVVSNNVRIVSEDISAPTATTEAQRTAGDSNGRKSPIIPAPTVVSHDTIGKNHDFEFVMNYDQCLALVL